MVLWYEFHQYSPGRRAHTPKSKNYLVVKKGNTDLSDITLFGNTYRLFASCVCNGWWTMSPFEKDRYIVIDVKINQLSELYDFRFRKENCPFCWKSYISAFSTARCRYISLWISVVKRRWSHNSGFHPAIWCFPEFINKVLAGPPKK